MIASGNIGLWRLALVSLITVIVFTACSGGDDDEPTATATVSSAPTSTATASPGVSTPTATPTPMPISIVGDMGHGQEVFAESGCSACHSIGTENNTGPGLQGISARGGGRVAGLSAEEYIAQSLKEPSAFVVSGFADIMPEFPDLSDEDMADLIAYLLSLDDPQVEPTPTEAPIDTSDLPALENVTELKQVAEWLENFVNDRSSVLTPSTEGQWLERLGDHQVILDVPDGHPVPEGHKESSLAAKSLMLSTTSMANEFFQVRYIDSSATLDSVIPKEPWIIVNHASVPMSTMRLLPSLTSVIGADGQTELGSMDTLTPIRAERSDAIAPTANSEEDYISIKTVWADSRVTPTLTLSQSMSLTRNKNELLIVMEAESQAEFGSIRVDLAPVPGLVPSGYEIDSAGATIRFPDRVGVAGSMRIESRTAGVQFSESSRGLLIESPEPKFELVVSAGVPDRPMSDLRLLIPDELIDQYNIGAVILRASPALNARIARFSPHGFSEKFEVGPYVVLVRDDALLSEPPEPGSTPVAPGQGVFPEVDLQPAFPNLPEGAFGARPTWASTVPDNSDRLVVLDQGGVIYVVDNDASATTADVYLDISDVVDRGGNERGLLGLAFHPEFAANGLTYVAYSVESPHNSRISEFKVSADGSSLDRASERILLDEPHPTLLHNGGALVFGPDGYLYGSLGDGGVYENGQDLGTLHASIFRIDVDSRSGNLPYGIPGDNPFVGVDGAREEIWAYGLRNPWRFTIDETSGVMWVADVGERTWEEVNILIKGANYGWSTMEGESCFSPAENCDQTGIELPVIAYSHRDGCAVIGGLVYRGSAMPDLQGAYIFADFCSGVITALSHDGTTLVEQGQLGTFNANISSFIVDSDGEMLAVAFVPGSSGTLYRVVKK